VLPLAAVGATLLGSWLVFGQPLAGRRRYRRLLAAIAHEPGARVRHFRRGIAGEWAAATTVGLLALLAHTRVRSLWPAAHDSKVIDQLPGLCIALLLVTLAYRVGGRGARRLLAVQLRPVAALLPHTKQEQWTFAGLALTAGVCEELIYRGFGLAALRWVAPSIGDAELIVITSVAFGLAHLYQGRVGVVLTGVLGAYFAWMTIATGTLLPAMLLHALVDLRILGLPLDAVPPAGM